MILNAKDRDIYNNFIKETTEYKEEDLLKYSSIIKTFINNHYNSNDSVLFDLDDFIQEAYALLFNSKDKMDNIEDSLQELYTNMNKYGEHEEVSVRQSDEVEIQIDLNSYLNSLEDAREKEVLKALLIDEDLVEKAKELNISNKEIKMIVVKLLNNIKEGLRNKTIKFSYVEKEGKNIAK